jgi:hypothetical protein
MSRSRGCFSLTANCKSDGFYHSFRKLGHPLARREWQRVFLFEYNYVELAFRGCVSLGCEQ